MSDAIRGLVYDKDFLNTGYFLASEITLATLVSITFFAFIFGKYNYSYLNICYFPKHSVIHSQGNIIIIVYLEFLIVLGELLCRANSHGTKRIVGGKDTNVELVPYIVSLQRDGKFYCGGSIISEYYVLTAAHCTDGPAR